jgi:hypothetical protein
MVGDSRSRHSRRVAVHQQVEPEQDFPAKEVYGYTPHPTLRLITCGGDYDEQTHHYLDRTVAFAVYAGERPVSPRRR